MIQILVRRRRYLLTIVVTILLVVYSFPVFASSSLSSLYSYASRWKTEVAFANNFSLVAQRNQSVSLFQQLNLTEEQHQQIKQIHRQYKQQIIRKKNTIAKLQQQLSDMMVGDESVEVLRAKNQQLSLLRQEIGTLRFESMLATREILTPQQRQKFRELVNSQLTAQ